MKKIIVPGIIILLSYLQYHMGFPDSAIMGMLLAQCILLSFIVMQINYKM